MNNNLLYKYNISENLNQDINVNLKMALIFLYVFIELYLLMMNKTYINHFYNIYYTNILMTLNYIKICYHFLL